ncbi:MAG: recombination protein O N-terminal domain-containing protein [Bacteroidales bacterium]|nr:recombination protein O N-terminal domain-containing protein [Bacteroidales bacterium]
MITEFEGFLLRKCKYSDNSIILNVYTKNFGLISLLHRIKKKKNIGVYLFPLSKVNGSFYYKPKNEIFNAITVELEFEKVSYELIYEVKIVAQLIAALFYNVCIYPLKDFNLYGLINKIYEIICTTRSFSEIKYIYIWALKELITILGFKPINNFDSENIFFDIEKAQFVKTQCSNLVLDNEFSEFLSRLLNMSFEEINKLKLTKDFEEKILTFFEKYLIYHLHRNISFKNVKEYLNLIEQFC